MRVDVGGLDDFRSEDVRVVAVEGVEIGIVRWNGELYALGNRCPHMGGPACSRAVALMTAPEAPGRLESDSTQPVVTCAWHNWEFDARSGRSVVPSRFRLKTYLVTVSDGRVYVELARRSGSSKRAGVPQPALGGK